MNATQGQTRNRRSRPRPRNPIYRTRRPSCRSSTGLSNSPAWLRRSRPRAKAASTCSRQRRRPRNGAGSTTPNRRCSASDRRHGRLGDDDALAQPDRAGHHDRAGQENAHRLSRPRPAHADGTDHVEEAEPGDVLRVHINRIVPRAYATNFNVPGLFGEFPKEFPEGQIKFFYLDLDKNQMEFAPGIVIPLKPFPGTRRRPWRSPAATVRCRPAGSPATSISASSARAPRSTFPCS